MVHAEGIFFIFDRRCRSNFVHYVPNALREVARSHLNRRGDYKNSRTAETFLITAMWTTHLRARLTGRLDTYVYLLL